MNPRNLQYQNSGRYAGIVTIRRVSRNILAILAVVFVLCWFLQAPPSFSQSKLVVINEIGWMGTSISHYDEWVELYNPTSSPIDLSGWMLKSVDGAPNIVLSGTIGAGGYFLLERTNDETIPGVSADQIYTGALEDLGEELELRDAMGGLRDSVPASSGWFAGDKDSRRSMERKSAGASGSDSSNWQTSALSPGTPKASNSEGSPGGEEEEPPEGGEEPPGEEKQQPQPAISFSSPSTVSVGTAFSVTVNLSNFKGGTYFLKVLIGKGDKFIYGNTKGAGGWLTQNGKWAEMPQVTIGSSGSKAVQAKTDGDVAAGNYLIKVRAYDGKNSFDSGTKSLTVAGSAKSGGTSRALGGEESGSNGAEEILGEVAGGDGEVEGEEAPHRDRGFKLNFYIILGIFGMFVGSGGLILAFRRGARRPQTPDTPESG